MKYDISMEKYPHVFIMMGAGLLVLLLWGPLFIHFFTPFNDAAIDLTSLYQRVWSMYLWSGETIIILILLSLVIGLIVNSIEYNALSCFRDIVIRRTARLLGLKEKWDKANGILSEVRWEKDEEHFERQMWLGNHPVARRDRDWDWFLSKSHALLTFLTFSTPVLVVIAWFFSHWFSVPIKINEGGWFGIITLLLVYLSLVPGYVKYHYDRALTDLAVYRQFKKERNNGENVKK
jgi:hypothetical protein